MNEIKYYKEIELKNPVMIAGWPGMGNVALGVIEYLRARLKPAKVAEIKIDPMLALDAVAVENGVAKLPAPPKNTFYASKNPELILFEGEVQLQGQSGLLLLDRVLDVASRFKVKMIYTGAAFPMPTSYKEPPVVYGAVNKKALASMFAKFGINPMEGGHISGLNGLLLGFASERNIDAACLLATIPQYAIGLPNPKASGAILEMLSKVIGFEVRVDDLAPYIKDIDEKMAIIEEKVKDVLSLESDEQKGPTADKKVPESITAKIEKLFREATLDRSKAIILKKELDRWDLYKLYEDRFLDLFKDKQ
ncbi:MAG: PAC2 family protein [Candidatus Omnitrophica bacterium]|nr:PAC2 family protein [Candidatus Omnitrophota bacterium]